jgi:hypothetical protein
MAGLFASGLSAAPVGAADPAKTLRVVLTSAEMPVGLRSTQYSILASIGIADGLTERSARPTSRAARAAVGEIDLRNVWRAARRACGEPQRGQDNQ